MKFSRFLTSMLLAAALVGQTFSQDSTEAPKSVPPVEINGHHIGETLLQFMVAEGTPQKFQECATLVLDPSTKKHYKADPNYWDDKGLVFKSRVDECVNLADGLKGKAIVLSSSKSKGRLTFADNKLVKISLVFAERPAGLAADGILGPSLSFDDLIHDLTAKFGPPDTIGQRQMQNGFGGIFTFPVATWTSRPDVTIYATQDRGETATYYSSVLIEERAYGERMVQLQNARPSVFQ